MAGSPPSAQRVAMSRAAGIVMGMLAPTVVFLGYVLFFAPGPQVRAVPLALPTPAPAVVHVAGEVSSPGVYVVPGGGRVHEALALAGGATEEGDPNQLNLAARVTDGQRILVPRKGAAAAPASASASGSAEPRATTGAVASRPVNLNTATFAQLDGLPGVGTVIAGRILEQRQKARFTRVEELVELKLVPAATFERLRDLIVVE